MSALDEHEQLPGEQAKKTTRQYGYKFVAENVSHRDWLDGQPMTTRCAECDWTFKGTAKEAREAHEAHRAAKHPELVHGRLSAKRKKEHAERDKAAKRALAAVQKERQQASAAREVHGAVKKAARAEKARGPARRRWARHEYIAALHGYVRAHGIPPRSADMTPANGMPSATGAEATFGSFANYIEDAGYPRPHRGRRSRPTLETVATVEAREALAAYEAAHPTVPARVEVRLNDVTLATLLLPADRTARAELARALRKTAADILRA